MEALRTDVAIIGGGLGACAAALAAARLGCRVILTEETHWLGFAIDRDRRRNALLSRQALPLPRGRGARPACARGADRFPSVTTDAGGMSDTVVAEGAFGGHALGRRFG